jgi:hypothetical protein
LFSNAQQKPLHLPVSGVLYYFWMPFYLAHLNFNNRFMLKKIAPDKWRHFYAGILMGAVLQGLGLWLLASQPTLATLIVLFVVIAVSYGFELFSKYTGMGIYDFMDAVASVIGGLAGMGMVWAIVCLL